MVVHVELVPSSVSALPAWTSALAVVAHPDDESFALGAVLDALVQSGCHVSVLCLTRGEASTVHGISGDLRALRAMELRDAGAALGLSQAELSDHPDGALGDVHRATLVSEVRENALRVGAHGLVVFDPSGVTGHPDHVAASEAALDAAAELGLPVLGWTLPRAVTDQLNEEFGRHVRRTRAGRGRPDGAGRQGQAADGQPGARQPGRPHQRAVAAAPAAGRPRAPALAQAAHGGHPTRSRSVHRGHGRHHGRGPAGRLLLR